MPKLTTETLHLFNKTKSIYLSCSFTNFNIVEIDTSNDRFEASLRKINIKNTKGLHFLQLEKHEALSILFDVGGFEVEEIKYNLYLEKRKEVIEMFIGKH